MGLTGIQEQNANGIDLNRDAQNQTQSEIKALMQLVENFQPQYNLNLHDQRTRFTVGDTDKEAAISFLSASADESRSITSTRLVAMQLINHMVSHHFQMILKFISDDMMTLSTAIVQETFFILKVFLLFFLKRVN